MRLDKYLKVSRLIKRRTVANEACDAGRVLINDKPANVGSGKGRRYSGNPLWKQKRPGRSAGRTGNSEERGCCRVVSISLREGRYICLAFPI